MLLWIKKGMDRWGSEIPVATSNTTENGDKNLKPVFLEWRSYRNVDTDEDNSLLNGNINNIWIFIEWQDCFAMPGYDK